MAGTFFSVGLLEATGTWGGVELVDVWGSGWMGPSCLPGSVWPSAHPHPAPSLSLSAPLDNLPELEDQSSPVSDPVPLAAQFRTFEATICSDFGAQENKVCRCFYCFSIYLP